MLPNFVFIENDKQLWKRRLKIFFKRIYYYNRPKKKVDPLFSEMLKIFIENKCSLGETKSCSLYVFCEAFETYIYSKYNCSNLIYDCKSLYKLLHVLYPKIHKLNGYVIGVKIFNI